MFIIVRRAVQGLNAIVSNSPHASFIKKTPNEGDREERVVFMSFSVIDKFVFIVFFCFVSCHDDYPFKNQSHVSYFDLEKGKVKDVQIFAERAKIIDNGYDIFERTDIQQIESPLNIFYCKYRGNDFPFHKIENVNMYYMPLKYMGSVADKISDVLISFNDKGYMMEYKSYDKNALTFSADFQYEDNLLKKVNTEEYIALKFISNLPDDSKLEDWELDYSKFDHWDRTAAYDTVALCFRVDVEYEGNYILKSVEQRLNEDIKPFITEYKYRKYDNVLVTTIIGNSGVDSCYLYLDGKYPFKAIYYDKNKKYDVLIKDNKAYSVLPKDLYIDAEYNNFGNMVKYKEYNIEYDKSGLPKRIIRNINSSLNLVYSCEYVYDDKGNWIQVNVTPEDRLEYDQTISLINDINRYIKNFDLKTDKSIDDYYDLAHKKRDLYLLEHYFKPRYEYMYSKFILYRKINYYN